MIISTLDLLKNRLTKVILIKSYTKLLSYKLFL